MGFIFVVFLVSVLVYFYFRLFPNKMLDIASLGTWAVVTGATDGIGKAFTHALADKGYNVVLISRSMDKLKSVAKEIEDTFQVSTKVVQADFLSLDENMYSRIQKELKDIDIGILVNNVGTLPLHPEYFVELEKHHEDLFQGILNCNITSAVNMTRYVLPGMVSRNRGLIINISSLLAVLPAPFYALYAATKSFILKFSQDLDTEYNDSGVHIHVLKTGLVATKMSGVEEIVFLGPSPQAYVESALEEVTKRRSSEGYISHRIVGAILSLGMMIVPDITRKAAFKFWASNRGPKVNRCEECKLRKAASQSLL